MLRKRRRSSNQFFQAMDDEAFKNQERALKEMEEYASNAETCRRQMMLSYFGQRYLNEKCRKNIETICDNCLKSSNRDSNE